MKKTRRQFLTTCARALALASLGPALTWEAVLARESPGKSEDPVLVAIHLVGGNDALNTLVPIQDSLYRKLRPQLALPVKSTPRLDSSHGLHPALEGLRGLYEEGKVAWVQGVGRPDHDRSHFRSSDLWQTAGDLQRKEGWLGLLADRHRLASVSVGETLSRALFARHQHAFAFNKEGFPEVPGGPVFHGAVQRMYSDSQAAAPVARALKHASIQLEEVVTTYRRKAQQVQLKRSFPGHDTGRKFELAARLLAAELPPRLLHLSVGDFDTHVNQAHRHEQQLRELDQSVTALFRELEHRGLNRRVVLFGYSEFGRRAEENASGGTDHGAGGLAFLLGGTVRGGLHGASPDLSSLRDGDLSHSTDYRELYASILAGHFGTGLKGELVPGFEPIKGLFSLRPVQGSFNPAR
ncbi:MAG: DUF1501 domain-containing protein [Armatimonadetes bacterium]|nr:DUF1501 domain-containing protein [Armatimonadota bacterium]